MAVADRSGWAASVFRARMRRTALLERPSPGPRARHSGCRRRAGQAPVAPDARRRGQLGRLRRQPRDRGDPVSAGTRTGRGSWPRTPSCSPPPPRSPATGRGHARHRGARRGQLDEDGIWRGDLYLRGGGDPTFGSRRFARRSYGGGATRRGAGRPARGGRHRARDGRVYGDESRFDSLRGGPDSGYGTSIWVGPLSALSFNRGLANESGARSRQPAGLRGPQAGRRARGDAACACGCAARRSGTGRRRRARERRLAADGAADRADQQAVGQLLRRDAAEGPGAAGQRPGHHPRRRPAVAGYARRLGSRARLWTARGCRAATAPRRARSWSCSTAMLEPTQRVLRRVLRLARHRGPRRHAPRPDAQRAGARALPRQDGHALDVSALSGYCEARSGDTYAFSILMNAFSPASARRLQDRMVQAIAATSESLGAPSLRGRAGRRSEPRPARAPADRPRR